ncbi:hypothetical protein RUM43_010810 [Polyplax serrata]|uniref:tRNA pseudouridine(55) synthase n=1 Tax=Polyplax serrata TaxID=468196 RepID=A0AAN8NRW2_POLSC
MVADKQLMKKIVQNLMENNVCNYCILRFLNEKNSDKYRNVDYHINEILDGAEYSPDIKKKKLNPCSACLGLLQMSESSEYMDIVVNNVRNAGHDCEDVTFALSLPITLLLRNRSIWLHLTDKYLEFFMDRYYSHEVKQEYLMVSLKEVWKWLWAEKIAAKLNKTANNGVDGNYHVNINVEYEEDDNETACLFKMFPKEFEYRSNHKRKFHGELLTRKKVESMMSNADIELFHDNYPVPPEVPKHFVKFSSVECVHDSIFIAGRYNKISRNLSQTPWMINGERRMETSVEEIIETPISKAILNSGIKFASSGREDVDVRTLGKGRPFVVDISNPRRTKLDRKAIKEIENQINSSSEDVFVRDLQVVQKEDLIHIKTGEESKTKTYTCFCLIKVKHESEKEELKTKLLELGNIKDLVIQQKTPIRVLHRRPLAIRPRTIYWMEAKFHEVRDGNFFFKLSLKVGAGTYIKEFVHGDFGRTTPSLTEILGKETDILALDVEEVALMWPPSMSDCSDKEE